MWGGVAGTGPRGEALHVWVGCSGSGDTLSHAGVPERERAGLAGGSGGEGAARLGDSCTGEEPGRVGRTPGGAPFEGGGDWGGWQMSGRDARSRRVTYARSRWALLAPSRVPRPGGGRLPCQQDTPEAQTRCPRVRKGDLLPTATWVSKELYPQPPSGLAETSRRPAETSRDSEAERCSEDSPESLTCSGRDVFKVCSLSL